TIMLAATVAAQGRSPGAAGAEPDRWKQSIANLRAPDLKARQAAANSLIDLAFKSASEKRTPARTEALKNHLKALAAIVRDKNEDPVVRALLVRAIGIGHFGPLAREIAPALIQVVLDETDQGEVRSWCAMILPDIGPPEAVGPAILAACQSRNTNV